MNLPLAGYTTRRLLRRSGSARVYEAQRERDGRRVLAKVFPVTSQGAAARVHHEVRLLQALDVDNVVRALTVERVGDHLVLLLDHVEGTALDRFGEGQPLDVEVFLGLAVGIVETLVEVHARGVVHRDIKPSNIVVEAATGRACLVDFGISVLLEDRRHRFHEREIFEGTLPYVSPEQTGRTGWEVDARSDLYSLGASFYELLGGRPPFEAQGALELVHAHIARRPRPLDAIRPGVPETLSAVIMRLLEKSPEDRYQTASGLLADLRRLAAGERNFRLGREDHTTQLRLPTRLYGRDFQLAALDAEISGVLLRWRGRKSDARLATGGRALVVLEGSSGSGKTALVERLDGMVASKGRRAATLRVAHGGYEGSGDTPYAGFVQALDGLLEQLLLQGEDELEDWRTRLREGLGSVAGVVCALLPRLSLILGETQTPAALPPGEARNRALLAFRRLIDVFAASHPMLLVLEDLQWARADSIELLTALVLDEGTPFTVIVTVGDDGQDTSPGASMVEQLWSSSDESGRAGVLAVFDSLNELGELPIRRLELEPLERGDLVEMLMDTLGRSKEAVAGRRAGRPGPGEAAVDNLADFVARKTGGNPQLVGQFLLHLASRGLLESRPDGWHWRLDALADAGVPDDLLSVVTDKLDALDESTQRVLGVAASIGHSFDLETLARACAEVFGIDDQGVSRALDGLEREGVIDLRGAQHRFVHGHIVELGSGMVSAKARAQVHALTGLLWLERHAGAQLEVHIYEIVDQLEAGRPASLEGLDQGAHSLAEYAALAGQRALDNGAWSTAQRYFTLACELLVEPLRAAAEGGRYDELVFTAAYGRAQALELTGARHEAEEAFGELQGWALNLAEFGDVVARRVRILLLNDRVEQAMSAGLAGLERCGFALSAKPGRGRVAFWVARGWRACVNRSAEGWAALPELDDTRMRAAVSISQALKNGALLFDLNLYGVLCGFEAWLTAKGVHPCAPQSLRDIAIAGGAAFAKPEQASRLADQAIVMCERPLMAAARARILPGIHNFVWPRSRAWVGASRALPRLIGELLELGEFETAGYSMALSSGQLLEIYGHLDELVTVVRGWATELERWGRPDMVLGVQASLRFAERLVHTGGPSTRPELVSAEATAAIGDTPILAIPAGLYRGLWAWLCGDWKAALQAIEPYLEVFEDQLFGSWHAPRFAMVAAVIEGEYIEHRRARDRGVLARMRRYERVTARWAKGCPENFGYMHELVLAERARARGKGERAMLHYERARAKAREAGARLGEGMACLRLASEAFRLRRQVAGEGAMAAAQRVFRQWGAVAVVERLAVLSDEELTTSIVGGSRAMTSSLGLASEHEEVASMDMQAVLSTVQLISEELDLEEVMGRVLTSALASAGAERGALLLEGEGGLGVVAEGDEEGVRVYGEGLSIDDEAVTRRLPLAAVHYVLRTGVPLVLDDASTDSRFAGDTFIAGEGVRSLLCMPIVKQSSRVGALLLENRLLAQVFTADRLEVLRALTAQAASALDNARLYDALQTSREQWRSLVSGVPDVITLLDDEGRLIFLNHLEPFGLSGQEERFVGQSMGALFDEDSREAWAAAVVEVAGGEREQAELEVHVRPREGLANHEAQRAMMVRVVAVGEQRDQLLAIATDISARKKLEATVRQQQRLESIGTLASGVAHEINNPVQGIMNYAELIISRHSRDELIDEFAGEIRLEADRVTGIVRNLLTFSRQEVDSRREIVDLREVIDATLSLARAVLRKETIHLEVEIEPGLPPVSCRPQQIRQIIMNLVTNARDAVNARYAGQRDVDPDCKRILLRARSFEGALDEGGAEGAAQTSGSGPGSGSGRWVRVSVEDCGTGIPDAIKAQIFDPFFTTKGRDQGTGLGLAVSHGIAVEHGGALSVDSELGVGTTFHLTLPAIDLDSEAHGD
ncbi:protein kinase domain-containing protein [Plesiocystis pacifica]|uniref:protein kinase domain-containing protein n=1 Tax=Plesiocystis pacifica TaxID=191768 RepID=UPI0018DB630A|nr:AAA family ATPase [Plesiocystis pacifica]